MQVDDSDLDITLKTPPNVRKIKSRSNSTIGTPRGETSSQVLVDSSNTPKDIPALMKKRKLAMKANSDKASSLGTKLLMRNVNENQSSTPRRSITTKDKPGKDVMLSDKLATPKKDTKSNFGMKSSTGKKKKS